MTRQPTPTASPSVTTAVALGLTACLFGASPQVAVAGVTVAPSEASPTAASTLYPRIVNGTLTASYPATGALLMYDDPGASHLSGLCSGTLIGCRTFVTAAHCVCPDNAYDAAACAREGTTDPTLLQVFLQQAGMFDVAAVMISPDYSFAERGDVAVLTLDEAVTGIDPSPINTDRRVPAGSAATIVGFGTTIAGRHAPDDAGIKRQGAVKTATCPGDTPNDAHVCWRFLGSGSNACEGDSGGPLFADVGSGSTLAAVTSGGNSFDCLAPDVGFDTDVFVNRAWILAAADLDAGTERCPVPASADGGVEVNTHTGQLDRTTPEARLQFEVPEGTALLRIALNGQLGSATAPSLSNDLDLYTRAGSAPLPDTFDCSDTNATPFGFCEIAAPHAGTWHVLVQRARGDGAFQLTATTFASPSDATCSGDCNRDGAVTVDEFLEGVRIALGADGLDGCPSFNGNDDATVTVDELLAGVRSALDGCPVSKARAEVSA